MCIQCSPAPSTISAAAEQRQDVEMTYARPLPPNPNSAHCPTNWGPPTNLAQVQIPCSQIRRESKSRGFAEIGACRDRGLAEKGLEERGARRSGSCAHTYWLEFIQRGALRPDSGQKGLGILFRGFSASKSDDQCLAGCAGGTFIECFVSPPWMLSCVLNVIFLIVISILILIVIPIIVSFWQSVGARGQIRIWSDRHIDRSRPTALSASLCTQQALMTMVMMAMMIMMRMMMMMMMMEGL